MKKIIIHIILVFVTANIALAQSITQNTYNRPSTSLNGKWHYIVDMYETGFYDYRMSPRDKREDDKNAFYSDTKATHKSDLIEYNFDQSPTMTIPGDWNTQDDKFFYYEGTLWFKRSFDYEMSKAANRVFVRFEAVNYRSDVYLNGKKLGTHIGGFTPFEFEVTHLLKEKDNALIIKVDNKRSRDAVPTINTDWHNYGGITRDVYLFETAATYVSDYKLQLKKDDNKTLEGFIQLSGEQVAMQDVKISIPELKLTQTFKTDESGRVAYQFQAKKIDYWHFNNPKLYTVQISCGEDMVEDHIGFRTISTQGTDILLNGESIFLRGICIHEENPMRGSRAYSMEDARLLLGWAKELGCNFVRLAHYPHNENMARLADEMGMMVWEENPVYWTILFGNESTYQNAEFQLKELISRDKNRASVIIWSMANETPHGNARLKFLKRLAATAREMDDSRLISAALEKNKVEGKEGVLSVNDDFADFVDIISFNEYVGWYDGLPEKCSRVKWEIAQDKPVFVSEFGAGALQGYHADKETRWSEEYQEDLYLQTIAMLKDIPQLRGMSPWIIADFRSPKRLLPNIQDGWNRKGLISETGTRKKAFFVLQDYYNDIQDIWEK